MQTDDSMAGHDRPHSSQTVIARRSYRASPEAVFDAWINPKSLAKWFGPPGYHAKILTHDLRVGGSWRFLMQDESGEGHHHFGTFVEIHPPERLAFTWASEEQVEGWRDERGNPTLVTVEISAGATGTEVIVTHENLISDLARRALTGGWTKGPGLPGDIPERQGGDAMSSTPKQGPADPPRTVRRLRLRRRALPGPRSRRIRLPLPLPQMPARDRRRSFLRLRPAMRRPRIDRRSQAV